MHLRRLCACSIGLQPLHQVVGPLAARGPGGVDGDEMRVVRESLRQALVPVPRRVEAVLKLANQVFVRLAHWDSLFQLPRSRPQRTRSVQLHAGLLDDLLEPRGFAADALGQDVLADRGGLHAKLIETLAQRLMLRMRSISESRRDTMAAGVLAGA